jgi:hypothetical protein
MKKSNHELILVIVDSILEDFPGNYQTFQGIIKTLREECSDSVEIKLARKKVIRIIKDPKIADTTSEEIVKLVALNRGIYSENEGLKLEKISKFVNSNKKDYKITLLEILTPIYNIHITDHFDWTEELQEIIQELISSLSSKDLANTSQTTLMSIFTSLDGKITYANSKVYEYLETKKYEIGYLELYLMINGKKLTDLKKLAYLEEYIKKINTQLNNDISSTKKMDIKKSILTNICGYLRTRIIEIANKADDKVKVKGQTGGESSDSEEEDTKTSSKKINPSSDKLKILGLFIV